MNDKYTNPVCKVTVKATGAEYYGYRNDKGELYYVRFVNGTKAEDVYAVTITDGVTGDCECKDHNIRLHECKHMRNENRVQEGYKAAHQKAAPVEEKPAAKVIDIATAGSLKGKNQGFSLLAKARA